MAAVSPCLSGQSCDEAADACVTECGTTEDADGDGVTSIDCGGTDCDDSDPDRYPGNLERCDVSGHDEDCNPATFGDRDLDGDLAVDAVCCNGTTCGTDCNDLVRGVNPSTSEVCDGYDNDCDGMVDEDVRVEVWPDADFDLHGDASPSATSSMQCPGTPAGPRCRTTATTRTRPCTGRRWRSATTSTTTATPASMRRPPR
ncbi:MAG: putative metal-binding motif-containing protein [Sandaracinaceae bacterium]|nr:putative metal-binding motif-containing protein [Sandaracinaceae bacterium]